MMPKWRPLTWVIVVISVLFLVWIIAGVAGVSVTALGVSIGVGAIAFFWFLVVGMLGIIWLVTRPSGRPCPVCGTLVKEGVTVCPRCGYDFRASGGPSPPIPTAPA